MWGPEALAGGSPIRNRHTGFGHHCRGAGGRPGLERPCDTPRSVAELAAPQRLDIYVPSLAIEYQGEQLFYPLDHLGGDQGLADRQAMDERKCEACRAAGVTLIEWRFDEPISDEAVRLAPLSAVEKAGRVD